MDTESEPGHEEPDPLTSAGGASERSLLGAAQDWLSPAGGPDDPVRGANPDRPVAEAGPAGRARAERERMAALVRLLDDDLPETWAAVRAALLETGRRARPSLERAAADSAPRRRARARTVLAQLDRRDVLRRLLAQATRGVTDLEAALFRLAAIEDPRFDARGARHRLDDLGRRVADQARSLPPGLNRCRALTTVLASEEGLRGPEDDYHAPRHVHLHRALESGRGLPLTLVAIYIFVARRAGLVATGVPLPGHVMLRLHAGEQTMLVDPFHAGAVRTRKECLAYLMRRGLAPRPDWFRDATDAGLFHRHVLNLANAHSAGGDPSTARDLQRVAGAVAAARGHHPAADPESA